MLLFLAKIVVSGVALYKGVSWADRVLEREETSEQSEEVPSDAEQAAQETDLARSPDADTASGDAPDADTSENAASAKANDSAEDPDKIQRNLDLKFGVATASLLLAGVGGLFSVTLSRLSIPGILYVSRDFLRSALRQLRKHKRLTVEALMMIVVVWCLFAGLYFLCTVNLFFGSLSRRLLFRIKRDARAKVTDLFSLNVRSAWIRVGDTEVEIPVEDLAVGHVVVVEAGGTIPVDGSVTWGEALIDQRLLTGESQPAERGVGDKVLAQTVVVSGRIHIEVERAGRDTVVGQIDNVLRATIEQKSERQTWVENVNDVTAPPFVLGGLALSPLLGADSAIAVINAHPKYKTNITVYMGMLSWIELASESGILIKDGRVLDELALVNTVVFDKTGTLTSDTLQVSEIQTVGDATEEEVLRLAMIAEQRQAHPIAQAIIAEGKRRGIPIAERDHIEYRVGFGLEVHADDRRIHIGSSRFFESEGIEIEAQTRRRIESNIEQGASSVLLARDGVLFGVLVLREAIREEARVVISNLRQQYGKRVCIISGDSEQATRNLAAALEVDDYFAEVLPQGKSAIIREFQESGQKVCFVGDGLNDTIALQTADVSISLSGASTVAIDAAQVVLLREGLTELDTLFDIGAQARTGSSRTFFMVWAPAIVGLGGALFLGFGLGHTIFLNQISMVGGMASALVPGYVRRQFFIPKRKNGATTPILRESPSVTSRDEGHINEETNNMNEPALSTDNHSELDWTRIHELGRALGAKEAENDARRLMLTKELAALCGGQETVKRSIEELIAWSRGMSQKSSSNYKALLDCVENLHREAMVHPILENKARYETMPRERVRVYASQTYEYVRCFPRFLGYLIANLPTDQRLALMVLTDNLVDECGGYDKLESGDTVDAHPRLFRRLLVALDEIESEDTFVTLQSEQRCADVLNEKFFSLSDSTDYLTALGAFGPGNECFGSKWLPILTGFRKSDAIPADIRDYALKFLEIHSPGEEEDTVEDEHGNLMLLLLARAMEKLNEDENKVALEKIASGADQALRARLAFFDKLDPLI